MSKQKEYNKAHKEGRAAYADGKTALDCPYPVPVFEDKYNHGWLLSANWLNGFRFAWFCDKNARYGVVIGHPNESKQFHNKIAGRRAQNKFSPNLSLNYGL